jgi:NTP pyrophosphatase (non-canonical NTP hydrolase)
VLLGEAWYGGEMSDETRELTVRGFQGHIAERYLATDKARGAAKTFLYLVEEFGELATAVADTDKKPGDAAVRANLEEEFADMVAWLCTLANVLDVDLEEAIRKKYLGEERPEGTK